MNKNICILILISCFSISLLANENKDKYLEVSSQIKDEFEVRFEKVTETDSFKIVVSRILELCDNDQDCICSVLESVVFPSSVYLFTPDLTLYLLAYLRDLYEEIGNKKRLVQIYGTLYSYNDAFGMRREAIIHLDKAIKLSEELGDEGRVLWYKIAKLIKNRDALDTKDLLAELNQYLMKTRSMNNKGLEISVLRNILYILLGKNELEKTEEYFKYFKDLLDSEFHDDTALLLDYHKMRGDFYFRQDKYIESQENYKEALRFARIRKANWNEAKVLNELARINWKLENRKLAKAQLDTAIYVGKKFKLEDLLVESYGIKYDLSEEEKDYEAVYFNSKKIDFYQDVLDKKKAGFDIGKYYLQLEKDQLAIEQKNSELELNARNDQLRYISIILILFAGLSTVLIIAFNTLRKKNKKVEEQNALIKKQADELSKLDIAKTRFFANTSHELRTPLSLILGPVHSLQKEKLKPNQQELLSLIQKNSKQLQNLVSSILDLNKIELGQMEVNEEAVRFNPFMKACFSEFNQLAEQKDINYSFESTIQEDLVAKIDSKKCKHIIRNILSNAFKYTHANGSIQCKSCIIEDNLHISFSDTGEGIHEDDIPHLFDRFFQTNQTNKKAEGGSGIGLALCKEYIDLFKGKINVESKLGEGTLFSVVFPITIIDDTIGEAAHSANKSTISQYKTKTQQHGIAPANKNSKPLVLVVEDNLDLQSYYTMILQDEYQILKAENGKQALNILYNTSDNNRFIHQKVDLIISDIMMPIMDGFQLLEKLKSSDETRHIPVVMVTGKATQKDELKALRIGVDSYITKPFVEEELKARIHHLIEHYRAKIEYAREEDDNPQLQVSSEDIQWLEEFECFIQDNIHQDFINILYLSSHFAMSESTLSRQLKRLTGITPKKYIQEIRLQKARNILEESDTIKVTQIASSVGFSDSRNFSRQFKKRFGKLPSEYKV